MVPGAWKRKPKWKGKDPDVLREGAGRRRVSQRQPSARPRASLARTRARARAFRPGIPPWETRARGTAAGEAKWTSGRWGCEGTFAWALDHAGSDRWRPLVRLGANAHHPNQPLCRLLPAACRSHSPLTGLRGHGLERGPVLAHPPPLVHQRRPHGGAARTHLDPRRPLPVQGVWPWRRFPAPPPCLPLAHWSPCLRTAKRSSWGPLVAAGGWVQGGRVFAFAR